MKVHYLGASRRSGISEKTGRPYDIAEVLFCVPDQSSEKRNSDQSLKWTYTAHGLRTQTIELAPGAIEEFAGVQPLTEVTLQVEPIPTNPSRNHVIGVVKK